MGYGAQPAVIISTPRLVLRPWQRSDLDAMADWPRFDDPLDALWNWPHVLREQGSAELFFLMRSLDAQRREWTITTTTGTVVGTLGIRDINEVEGSARLGIGFGKPHIGLGYGFEALSAFLDVFFGRLGFAQMVLDVSLHNTPARRLYERLGFQETDTFWYEAGPVIDHLFLREPRYAAIQEHIRWGTHSVFIRYAAMVLDAAMWLRQAENLGLTTSD